MDYSTQVLSDSTAFDSSHYVNLKLKSPSPSPFQDHASDSYNNFTLEPIREPLQPSSPLKSLESQEYESLEISTGSLIEKVEKEHLKAVSTLDVYKKILGLTVGKDKLTKTLSYILHLIKYYLINTRRYIVDEKFDNLSINPLEHYTTPIKYLKLLLFLNSTTLEKKITLLTTNISLFRFALRFGGTPYRIKVIFERFTKFWQTPTLDHFQKVFFNESFLSEFINFYYGIVDELLLLCNLGVLNNKPLRKFVGRHVDVAWYYDILLSLKQNWWTLSDIKSKQMQLNIQYQVRKRASQLSKKLVENIDSSPLRSQILKEFNNKSPSGHQNSIVTELKQLKHDENMIKIDLFKLLCDLVCDSVDVFDLKIHRVIYLVCGLCSGASGLSKVWINAEKELKEQ